MNPIRPNIVAQRVGLEDGQSKFLLYFENKSTIRYDTMQSNVETDSLPDLVVDVNDPMDPVAVLHVPAHAAGLNNVVDPVLVAAAAALAVEPQTDAGERQAFITEDSQVTEGFVPLVSATAEPRIVVGTVAGRVDAERAAAQPIAYPYFGLPAPVLSALPVDGGHVPGRELTSSHAHLASMLSDC